MKILIGILFVLLPMLVVPAQADFTCDGIDDFPLSNSLVNTKITTTTGTVFVTVRHPGSPSAGGTCGRDQIWVYNGGENVALVVGNEPRFSSKNFDTATKCANGGFTTNFTTLVWKHAAGNLELYMDGVLQATTASGTTTGTLSSSTSLCWNNSTADAQSPVTIAQVVFYNTDISAAQIAAYGQSFIRGRYPPGPTAVWDFERCVHGASVNGQVFQDFSGNNRTITGGHGANATGMTCAGSSKAVKMPGVY